MPVLAIGETMGSVASSKGRQPPFRQTALQASQKPVRITITGGGYMSINDEGSISTNDEVREYLDYYLSSELESDFAVMLNGPWGAGKTHFIKAYLEEREDKARLADPLYSVGHLYASLYGIRSTSEITDQFFAQAHPVMNFKAVRLIGTVMSRALVARHRRWHGERHRR